MLVVTACLQGTLLAMGIYFEYFGPESKQKAVHHADSDEAQNGFSERAESAVPALNAEPSEETPLLQSQ